MESTTRNRTNSMITEVKEEETWKESIKTYLFNPISAGLVGFSALFSIILVTKFIGFLFGSYDTFSLGVSDVIYSLIGFLFVTSEKFLEFFIKED